MEKKEQYGFVPVDEPKPKRTRKPVDPEIAAMQVITKYVAGIAAELSLWPNEATAERLRAFAETRLREAGIVKHPGEKRGNMKLETFDVHCRGKRGGHYRTKGKGERLEVDGLTFFIGSRRIGGHTAFNITEATTGYAYNPPEISWDAHQDKSELKRELINHLTQHKETVLAKIRKAKKVKGLPLRAK